TRAEVSARRLGLAAPGSRSRTPPERLDDRVAELDQTLHQIRCRVVERGDGGRDDHAATVTRVRKRDAVVDLPPDHLGELVCAAALALGPQNPTDRRVESFDGPLRHVAERRLEIGSGTSDVL